jgi:hypothetical protein
VTTRSGRYDRAGQGVSAGAPAAIAAPARPRASLRDDSRVAQLNLRVVDAPPTPVIRTTYSSRHNTLLRGPVESGLTATVGVVDQSAVGATSIERHLERVDDQL